MLIWRQRIQRVLVGMASITVKKIVVPDYDIRFDVGRTIFHLTMEGVSVVS
jgi:hypothetical protein